MSLAQPIPPIARVLLALGLVGGILLLLHLAAPVLVPVLFAFFLAALAMPTFQWLQGRGVRRGLALFLLVGALLGGGIAVILLALAAISHLQAGLALYSDQLQARVADLGAALAQRGIELAGAADQAAAAGASALSGFLRAMANAASNALVSLMIVAFFLLESQRFLGILRSERVRSLPLLGQAPQVAHTAVQYFGIRTRLNLLTGAGVSVHLPPGWVWTTRCCGASWRSC